MEKNAVKRCRVNGTFRWASSQVEALLDAILLKVRQNVEKFEKPTAQLFYTSVMKNNPHLEQISWQIAKTKLRHLKTSYVSAVSWRNQTVAGLMDDGCADSVKTYIKKICPHYNILQEIFGERRNVQPRNVYATNDEFDVFDELSFRPEDFIECESDSHLSNTDFIENMPNFPNVDVAITPTSPTTPPVSPAPTSFSTATPPFISAASKPKKSNTNNLTTLLQIQEKKTKFRN